jgi:hypothetical protein
MKQKIAVYLLAILLGQFLFPVYGQQIISYIEKNQFDSVAYFLEQGNDINGIYPQYTPLEIAIRLNKKEMVEFLTDQHANVNQQNNQTSPLFIGVICGHQYHSNRIVELLVEEGAKIDFIGQMGLTPFLLACKIGNSPAARFLYEKGANHKIHDQAGNNFFYYVLRGRDPDLISYFTSNGFKIPRMSSVLDGPHIRWKEDLVLEINYMRYNKKLDRAEWTSEIADLEKNITHPFLKEIELVGEKNTIEFEEWTYEDVDKIFVVSDIHGHFDPFVNLLTANNIIDEDRNWIWGKGHLVINGDVFDRGDQVTECLWLIYKLEKQAEDDGGKVHFILGNHELLILKDLDKSYANEKYVLPYVKAGIEYTDLFGFDFELGRWLRSKNVVQKINRTLFVHGGIPFEFADIGQDLETMNQFIHTYLAGNSDSNIYLKNLAIQPAWYRGYFDFQDHSRELKRLRNYYQVKHIVVGHTTVDKIKPIQDGSVIAIGIHYGETGIPAQGLLINNKKFYRVDENGNKKEL